MRERCADLLAGWEEYKMSSESSSLLRESEVKVGSLVTDVSALGSHWQTSSTSLLRCALRSS